MQNRNMAPPAVGRLTVFVRTAGGALPVGRADVTVTSEDGSSHTAVTDESGKTPVLLLPTPEKDASLAPGGARPYALYRIRTVKDGYYTAENVEVPLFPDILSVQPVELLPLPPYENEAIRPVGDTFFSAGQNLE